jgi:PAS domain S-box-containing protein
MRLMKSGGSPGELQEARRTMSPDSTSWPTQRMLAIGYAVAIAALSINAAFTYWNLSAVRASWDTLQAGRDYVRGIDKALSDLKDAETGQRGYIITGDERYLEPYTKSQAGILESIDRLRSLAGDSAIRQGHVNAVAEASAAKLAELERTIAIRRQDGLDAAIALVRTDRGKEDMDRVRALFAAMRAEEDATRGPLRQRLQAAITRTTLTFTFASALALALLFGVHLLSQRSRDQLRRYAAWLSTTLRSIGDAVIATDGQGRVTLMNSVAEQLTAWTTDEARGKLLDEVFRITSEETGDAVPSPVDKVLREGAVVGLANHTVLTARDGTRRPIEDSAAPIKDAESVRGVVLVFRDATAARMAQAHLLENDKRKDEFLAMLAHELRNPLAAMGHAVALSRRSRLQEHVDWSMEVINRQIKHLSRLIDDLLDVSRINRGKIELRRDMLDATPILDSAVETVRPLADERKHKLSVTIDRGNLWVNVDPTRLEQVVTNLLTNAAKYTENGGNIWLTAGHEEGNVVITVKDTGVGIPPEKLPEMFELFAQGDRTLARSEGGLGIGLTVVKKLVQMHGGTITASSEGIDKGSKFSVRLPEVKRPAAFKTPVTEPALPARSGARILVVDDNLDTARGMARLLELLGHDVKTAHDGSEAIEVARAQRPEFVLLDIGLPGMDGYEVAAQLRQDGCCRGAVFIAISGYGQDEDRRRSKEAGFDYHLVKPIDHDALLTLLSHAGAGG